LAAKASLRMRRASPTSPASHFSLAAISHSTSACARSGRSQIRQPAPHTACSSCMLCSNVRCKAAVMPIPWPQPCASIGTTHSEMRKLLSHNVWPVSVCKLVPSSASSHQRPLVALPVRGCCEPAATSQPGRLYRDPRPQHACRPHAPKHQPCMHAQVMVSSRAAKMDSLELPKIDSAELPEWTV
jgi:hypothetical protein